MITSHKNEQLKRVSKLLQSAKYRREQACVVLEGVHLLEAYLNAGHTPTQVFIPQHRREQHDVQQQLFRLPEHTQMTWVADGVLNKISDLHHADDIISLINLPRQTGGNENETVDCVVLDAVQDAGNIGTILRSAAAAGVAKVVLGMGCADAWSPKVLRAGMGAHFLLQVVERVDLAQWLPDYGGRILATALSSPKHYDLYDGQLDLCQTNAWLFGNEGQGVSASYLAHAHATVKIPMLGQTESLNVAMATTICLFEQLRQRLCFQAA